MTVARFAISLDSELAREVRKAVGKAPTSTWFAEAARQKLRSEGLLRAVAEWESVHGTLSETELRKARQRQERAANAVKRRRR
jgi:hypothetical protein